MRLLRTDLSLQDFILKKRYTSENCDVPKLKEKLQRFVAYFYFPCGEKVLVTLTHCTVFRSHPVVSLAHQWFKSFSGSGLEIYCINIFHKSLSDGTRIACI